MCESQTLSKKMPKTFLRKSGVQHHSSGSLRWWWCCSTFPAACLTSSSSSSFAIFAKFPPFLFSSRENRFVGAWNPGAFCTKGASVYFPGKQCRINADTLRFPLQKYTLGTRSTFQQKSFFIAQLCLQSLGSLFQPCYCKKNIWFPEFVLGSAFFKKAKVCQRVTTLASRRERQSRRRRNVIRFRPPRLSNPATHFSFPPFSSPGFNLRNGFDFICKIGRAKKKKKTKKKWRFYFFRHWFNPKRLDEEYIFCAKNPDVKRVSSIKRLSPSGQKRVSILPIAVSLLTPSVGPRKLGYLDEPTRAAVSKV